MVINVRLGSLAPPPAGTVGREVSTNVCVIVLIWNGAVSTGAAVVGASVATTVAGVVAELVAGALVSGAGAVVAVVVAVVATVVAAAVVAGDDGLVVVGAGAAVVGGAEVGLVSLPHEEAIRANTVTAANEPIVLLILLTDAPIRDGRR